jgi:hypothetical protein
MSSEWNDLERRLDDLGSAVGGTGLPGPGAARQRAKQRSRRHATSAALSAALVLAGGTFAVAQLTGTTPTDIAPIAPTDTSPTATEDPGALEAGLMRPDDIMTVTIEGGEFAYSNDSDTWSESSPHSEPSECVPDADDLDHVSHAAIDFEAESDGDLDPAHVRQDLYLTAPGEAPAIFAGLTDTIHECVERTLDVSPIEGIGDEGWLIRYWYGEPQDEIFGWLTTMTVVRYEDVVSVITDQHRNTEVHIPPEVATTANAAARMCEALFGTDCVGDRPSLPDIDLEVYLPVLGGDEPDSEATNDPDEPDRDEGGNRVLTGEYLTADQINPVGEREPFVPGTLSEGGPSWESLCMDDPRELDAALGREDWTDFNDASLYQVGLEFGDSAAADQWMRGYTAIEDRCAVFDIEERDGTVVDNEFLDLASGEDALVWSVFYAPPDAGTAFHGAGMARRDNVVVMLIYGGMDGPDGPGNWVGYVSDRLEALLDRAVS